MLRLIAVMTVICLLPGCWAPRAGVEVHVERVPVHHWFYLVQENEGVVSGVQYYLHKIHYSLHGPWTVAIEVRDEEDRGIREGWRPLRFLTHWDFSEKYGVLVLDDTGLKVWWFTAAELPVENRDWLMGGGRVRFRLDPARAETATRSQALQWGVRAEDLDNPGPLR